MQVGVEEVPIEKFLDYSLFFHFMVRLVGGLICDEKINCISDYDVWYEKWKKEMIKKLIDFMLIFKRLE